MGTLCKTINDGFAVSHQHQCYIARHVRGRSSQYIECGLYGAYASWRDAYVIWLRPLATPVLRDLFLNPLSRYYV